MTEGRHTFVLVHGAWCGGWVWTAVREALEAQGHRVFAPTLPGLADRADLLGPGIDLTSHVLDVVDLFRREGLRDIVLVGHSYGGLVISGIADLVAEGAIRSIVYLDAFYLGDGERAPIPQDAVHRPHLVEVGGVRCFRPPRSGDAFGLTGDLSRQVDAAFTPMPVACFAERPTIRGRRDHVPVKTFILCELCTIPFFRPMADALDLRPDWRVERTPHNHMMMLEQPELATRMLLRAVAL